MYLCITFETSSLALGEEHRLRVLEIRVLRIVESLREAVI
jgi:hypothetical protein